MNKLIPGILFFTICFFLPLSSSFSQEAPTPPTPVASLDFEKLNRLFQNISSDVINEDPEGPFKKIKLSFIEESTDIDNDKMAFALKTILVHPSWTNESEALLNGQLNIELMTDAQEPNKKYLDFVLGASFHANSLNVAKDLFSKFLVNKWEEEVPFYGEEGYLIDFPSSEVAFHLLPEARTVLKSKSLDELFDRTQEILKRTITVSKDVVHKLEGMLEDNQYEFEWDIIEENIEILNGNISALEHLKMEKTTTEDGNINITIDATSSLNLVLGNFLGGDISIAEVSSCILNINPTLTRLEGNAQLKQYLGYYFQYKERFRQTLIAAQNGIQTGIDSLKGMFTKIYYLLRGFITA